MAVLEKIAEQGDLSADELRAFVADACGTMDLDDFPREHYRQYP